MPIYEYTCQDCGKHFETLRSMKDADAPSTASNATASARLARFPPATRKAQEGLLLAPAAALAAQAAPVVPVRDVVINLLKTQKAYEAEIHPTRMLFQYFLVDTKLCI